MLGNIEDDIMRISEWLVNNHRITFYDKEKVVELEEFVNNDFKNRIIIPQKDFDDCIRLYEEWKKEE